MYEELIAELREEAEWAKANEWETPIMLSDHLTQAADAIEELNMIATSNERSMKAWAGTAVKAAEKIPRWIPVKEPPKEGKPVFVHIPCRYRKQESIPMIAFWEQGQWKEYESHRLVYNITHWMPLPEPPKEET